MRFRRWKPFVGNLSIIYNTRTGWVKPRFKRFRLRKRVRNVRLHARHYHLLYAFSTKIWVYDTETVIIPGKISIIPPKVPPTGKGKTPKAPPLLKAAVTRPRPLETYCRPYVVPAGRSVLLWVSRPCLHHPVHSPPVARPPHRTLICGPWVAAPQMRVRPRVKVAPTGQPFLCSLWVCCALPLPLAPCQPAPASSPSTQSGFLPTTDTDRCAPPRTVYDLLAANRTPITTYGTQTFFVALLPSIRFPWAFMVADVEQTILGMDFLATRDLLLHDRLTEGHLCQGCQTHAGEDALLHHAGVWGHNTESEGTCSWLGYSH
ncbi:hypothetical protein E2C01_002424 [Portunus trituberculatus]|uniref:Uncharacterized protein n=1 Tax=Portunus trituberculatus TaxID=210409 RepID=A0A5B7CN76_PORTR|nr:hypothetical protein [Portunus trituberculatus]